MILFLFTNLPMMARTGVSSGDLNACTTRVDASTTLVLVYDSMN
jgi:hypothetical protein